MVLVIVASASPRPVTTTEEGGLTGLHDMTAGVPSLLARRGCRPLDSKALACFIEVARQRKASRCRPSKMSLAPRLFIVTGDGTFSIE